MCHLIYFCISDNKFYFYFYLVSRRFSRSPPRRRPYSPAPYRSRPRSRSRSLQPRRFRSGNYSRASPHSRSRSRSPHHHDRSPSRSQVHLETEAHNPKTKSRAASPVAIKLEACDALLNVEVPMAEDRKPLSQPHVAEVDVKPLNPPPDTLTLNQPISRSPNPSLSQVDIKPEIRMASPVLQTLETKPAGDREIIETIESASQLKTSPQSPMPIQAQPSPSSPRFPRNMPESAARVLPTGPQRNWPSRSPPRGPRSHPRQPIPPSVAPSYGSVPRGPRRGFPPTGPSSSFSSPASIPSRHNPESKKNAKTLDPDLDVRSLSNVFIMFLVITIIHRFSGPRPIDLTLRSTISSERKVYDVRYTNLTWQLLICALLRFADTSQMFSWKRRKTEP